jgi:hypothetical protein
MLKSFLGIKNSTRNLTDIEFDAIVPSLAEELSNLSYIHNYSETELRKDWQSLLNYDATSHTTASTTRIGMKLCEQFFPNFYDIKNSKGVSFSSLWTPTMLEKVLRWNRKSHSTPYLSEIKRGIYFCGGLTKNTMYRPHLAKTIVTHYNANTVLDPCAGWGGRLLGTVSAGAHYIGYEPNTETYNNLVKMVEFLEIGDHVTLYNLPAEQMNDVVVDISLTSPPYFNLEIYSEEKYQSENYYTTYNKWLSDWLTPLVISVTQKVKIASCWNVHNIGKMKMIDDIRNIHHDVGFTENKTFSLSSSARQATQNITKNKKNKDITVCYERV